MKQIDIDTKITICSYEELSSTEKMLIDCAKEATERAYAPYSHFHVGAAALLVGGGVVTGSNQENAAYPSGLCAERVALFYANSQYPDAAVEQLAIAAFTHGNFTEQPISPCAACRQVILECENRYKRPMQILMYGTSGIYKIESVRTLVPLGFGADDLTGSTNPS